MPTYEVTQRIEVCVTFTVNAPDDTEPETFAELSARVTVDPLPADIEGDGFEVFGALVEDCWITDSEVTPIQGLHLDGSGELRCHCGNTPSHNGFSACNRDGERDDALLHADSADALFYLCERCGLVSGPWPSVTIVGRVEL